MLLPPQTVFEVIRAAPAVLGAQRGSNSSPRILLPNKRCSSLYLLMVGCSKSASSQLGFSLSMWTCGHVDMPAADQWPAADVAAIHRLKHSTLEHSSHGCLLLHKQRDGGAGGLREAPDAAADTQHFLFYIYLFIYLFFSLMFSKITFISNLPPSNLG